MEGNNDFHRVKDRNDILSLFPARGCDTGVQYFGPLFLEGEDGSAAIHEDILKKEPGD
jgi:hypothetical protein